jgi:aminoglycoside phosphotransferase (APT) family kinase protein
VGIMTRVDEEVPLEGGAIAQVVRVGDTVRRSTGPWTPAVHEVLRHLEAVDCDLAPRVLGFDEQGREILTHLPGSTIQPHHVHLLERDETLVRAGAFVSELHAALPRHPDGTMALHGDLGTWNVLVDGDRWFAIDWDSTHRGEPLWEVSYCLLSFCSLWQERSLAPAEAVRRMRLFAVGSGIGDADLARAIALLPARCDDVGRAMRQQADEGIPGLVRLVEQGHDAMWRTRGTYAASQLPSWLDALAP